MPPSTSKRPTTTPLKVAGAQLSSQLEIGTVVDQRYLVEASIASGAMGWVYKTRHLQIDRPTAIKVLDVDQPILDTLEYRERFCYEAQVVAAIDHPNVIKIFDCGFFGPRDIPYIAMQYLEGHDLGEEIKKKPVNPLRALRFMDQALSALSVAHQQGIVHKDLKPANLFIQHPYTPNERLIVLDFGVARMQHEENGPGMTQIGEIAGTPEYLPPEYITRQTVSTALDVYSMALVFIELLTGESVIKGRSAMERLMMHLRGPIPIPAVIEQSVLAPLLRRSLNPNPVQRFKNATGLLKALRGVESTFIEEIKRGLFSHSTAESFSRPRSSRKISAPLPTSQPNPWNPPRASTTPTPQRALQNVPGPLIQVANRQASSSQAVIAPQSPLSPPKISPRALQRPGQPAQESDFKELFRQAVAATRQRLYSDALELFEECLRLKPGHRLVERNIMALQRRLGD